MKSYAKVNLFLKLLNLRSDNYCEIASRFALVPELFDEIFLIPNELAKRLNGASLNEAKSAIYEFIGVKKADSRISFLDSSDSDLASEQGKESLRLVAFLDALPSSECKNTLCNKVTFFNGILSNFYTESNIFSKVLAICGVKQPKNLSIVLLKNIPTFAGLGGASSNAATLLKLLNNEGFKLNINEIAPKIGADVSFFTSGAKSANVRGFGDQIEILDDVLPPIKLAFSTPCDTVQVYKVFKNAAKFSPDASEFFKLKNSELLELENTQINDLLSAVLQIYPQTKSFVENNWFLSGSGGTFFTKLEGNNQ